MNRRSTVMCASLTFLLGGLLTIGGIHTPIAVAEVAPAPAATSAPTPISSSLAAHSSAPLQSSEVSALPATLDDSSDPAYVRAEFGLAADPSAIAAATADQKSTTAALGIPLTPAETANIYARDALGRYVGEIDSQFSGNPLYDDASVDQSKGGVIVVGVTQGASLSALEVAIKDLLPSTVPVEFRLRTTAARTLRSDFSQIESDDAAGKLSQYGVSAFWPTVTAIVVQLSTDAPADAAESIEELYPWPFLHVQTGDPVAQDRDNYSGDIYGGEWIGSADATSTCSAGFADAVGGSSNSSYYEITDGHCGEAGSRWTQGSEFDGNNFGTGTHNNGWYTSSHPTKCDCQSIGPVPESATTSRYYLNNSDLSVFTIMPTNTSSDYYNGRRVCMSGAAYSAAHNTSVCGTITTVNQDINEKVNGSYVLYFTNMVQTTVKGTIDGDSGAPVWGGTGGATFMGLHQGLTGSNGYEVFSRSTYISSVTGTTITFG